jgi:probable phosphomutase (TIGR03848 family)
MVRTYLHCKVYLPTEPGDESGHREIVLFDRGGGSLQMTTFLLIRHALCDPVGRSIAGRSPGVSLNQRGLQQAEALALRMAELPISAVYSSPLDRAVQTARAIAERKGLRVEQREGLNEIDFGDWTGKQLAELQPVAEWQHFNTYRSGTRIPGGETMQEVLARALNELADVARLRSSSLVAVVSHGDVLRSLICHFLGVSLDLMLRLEIDPASVSIVELQPYGPRVLLVNGMEGWPGDLRRH